MFVNLRTLMELLVLELQRCHELFNQRKNGSIDLLLGPSQSGFQDAHPTASLGTKPMPAPDVRGLPSLNDG